MKFDKDSQDRQKALIESGYQHYRYVCDNADKVFSITCLNCNTTSIEPFDIQNQYCRQCNKYHFTPT